MAMKVTCFADEISQDLEEQLQVLSEMGLVHLEIRSVWGKNVLELNAEELDRINGMVKERGFGVSSIASPVGKYAITEPFAPQLESLKRAVSAAKALGTPYIRIFSYFIPKNESRENYKDEVLNRMKQLAQIAEREGVILILENDSQLYGTSADNCIDIFHYCASASMKAAFDPGNYIIEGIHPMEDAYPKIADMLEYVHIKDASSEPRMFVPAGKGDGRIGELLSVLQNRGFGGFLSVEPHLNHYMPDKSNPERVIAAIQALQSLLKDNQIDWQ